MSKNNWYVLTGAPSSGKTTLLKQLEKKAYKVFYEQARLYIDEQLAKGKTLQEIRADEVGFQKKVLKLKINFEKKLEPEKIIFMERGIPDTTAYLELIKATIDDTIRQQLANCNYKKVFLIELLNFRKDYARTENLEKAQLLELLLEKAYEEIGVKVVRVPKMSIDERVQFILNNL